MDIPRAVIANLDTVAAWQTTGFSLSESQDSSDDQRQRLVDAGLVVGTVSFGLPFWDGAAPFGGAKIWVILAFLVVVVPAALWSVADLENRPRILAALPCFALVLGAAALAVDSAPGLGPGLGFLIIGLLIASRGILLACETPGA